MDGNEIVLWLAQQKCTARLIIITGYTPDYAAHAKVLAEYKGIRPVTTLYKPIEVSELRAVLGSQNSLRLGLLRKPGTRPYRVERVAWADTNASLCSFSSSSVRC